MITENIADLLRKIGEAEVPVSRIGNYIPPRVQRGIVLDGAGKIKIYVHLVTDDNRSGTVKYSTLSYYVREEDGLPMLEQLQRGVGFIEACGYCVTEWGEGTQPDSVEGYATIQEGYVLGGISLDLTTHLLAPYKLKFNPLGERVQMSSNHGPVEPEKISEALDRMR